MQTAGHARRDGGTWMILLVILYGLALGLSVTMLVRGHYELGVLGVMLVLTLAPIAFALMRARSGQGGLAEIERSVKSLAEQSLLSDDARRVLNRSAERDLLVAAIEEDISIQSWDAAMVLIGELADRFGYRADAENLRRRVEESRRKTREMEITESIGFLDGLILQRRWDEALADAGRIQRLFPDSPRVEPLRERVATARAAYRQDLERRMLLAAQEDRSEEALGLLKELDLYLTPEEAEPLRERARGVIGRARDNLGAQFKLAVQDKRWREAVSLGDLIVSQFPNTRMAAEVREVIEGIRQKAGGVA